MEKCSCGKGSGRVTTNVDGNFLVECSFCFIETPAYRNRSRAVYQWNLWMLAGPAVTLLQQLILAPDERIIERGRSILRRLKEDGS